MLNRRQFIGAIPVSAVAISAAGSAALAQQHAVGPATAQPRATKSIIASPPVVQNPRADGFGVSVAVSGLATAWVEYGFAKNDLPHTVVASHHGLIAADDTALHVRVPLDEMWDGRQTIYYRVVAQSLSYRGAYRLQRGEPVATPVYALQLPSAAAKRVRLISINDTHENVETIRALHTQIETLSPDALVWNGDTCNDFDAADQPEQVLLNPAQDLKQAWAATRPMLFSNGNHDIRGVRAREAVKSFAGAPESVDLPYNQALRIGPLALITLDTGEDKPDHHPVFAGTANYQPYRQRQSAWLKQAVQRPDIKDAPFKIATCHIPLRGLPDHNDGTTLNGYAYYSGFGASLWLPTLKAAGFNAVLSGHTHRARHDQPTNAMPIHQFVGGGPRLNAATMTIIDAAADNGQTTMRIRLVNLAGDVLAEQAFGG